MKRSEMVTEMALRFEDIYGYGLEESKALADDLLSLCEGRGMSPPSMRLPTKAVLNGKEINVGNIITISMWEPEQDDK